MIKKIFLTLGSLIILASNAFAFDMPEGTIGISPLGGTPQMQQYSLAVGKKIIANFNMPDTGSNLAALVIFKVDKTGKLTECEIVQSSGNTDYDNRVLTAVKNASPYPAPNFDEATDVGVLLNMDLNIIKLIKMLSGLDSDLMNMDLEELLPSLNQFETETTPQQIPTKPTGKKFVNPYEIEKSLE